jgi:hypothetical protein
MALAVLIALGSAILFGLSTPVAKLLLGEPVLMAHGANRAVPQSDLTSGNCRLVRADALSEDRHHGRQRRPPAVA